MDPLSLGAGLAAGGLSFAGQAMTNAANVRLAHEATQASKEMAREQMAFQERMSNTAYQRGMQDMRAAGLNPMLAFMKGGASTPSGAMGSPAVAHVEDSLSKGVSSAMAAAQLSQDLQQKESQTALNRASADAAGASAQASRSTAARNDADTLNALVELQAKRAELGTRVERAKYEGRGYRIDNETLLYDKAVEKLKSGFGVVNSAVDLIRPGIKGVRLPTGGDQPPPRPGDAGYDKYWNARTREVLRSQPRKMP